MSTTPSTTNTNKRNGPGYLNPRTGLDVVGEGLSILGTGDLDAWRYAGGKTLVVQRRPEWQVVNLLSGDGTGGGLTPGSETPGSSGVIGSSGIGPSSGVISSTVPPSSSGPPPSSGGPPSTSPPPSSMAPPESEPGPEE